MVGALPLTARMSEDLRERFSESLVHDRRMVEERSRLLEQMASLIQKLDDRASEQKACALDVDR